jgi:hypothetical protein
VHEVQAVDVTEQLQLVGEQGAAAALQEPGLVVLVAVVGFGGCVPRAEPTLVERSALVVVEAGHGCGYDPTFDG